MKKNTLSPLHVLLFSLILIFQFSCSKDSDLMTDYVLADAKEDLVIGKFVVDDTFETTIDNPIVLDVLANDTFENEEEVIIAETSAPENGTAEINADNTITYTPETQAPAGETVDTFTYTTEVATPDETVITETATVTVTVTQNTSRDLTGVNFSAYGATNNGSSDDDTAELQAALDAEDNLIADAGATFYISKTLDLDTRANQTIEWNGATIVTNTTYLDPFIKIDKRNVSSATATIMYDLLIDANNKGTMGLRVLSKSTLTNIDGQDYIGPPSGASPAHLRVEFYNDNDNYGDWLFDGCDVDGLQGYLPGNGTSGVGASNGYIIYWRAIPSSATTITFQNATVKNGYGVDGQNIGIFSPGLSMGGTNGKLEFKNITTSGWERRSVKAFCGNLYFENCTFNADLQSNATDTYPPAGFLAIGASSGASGASNIVFEGCNFVGQPSGTRDNRIIPFDNVTNLEFNNCTFSGSADLAFSTWTADVKICSSTFGPGSFASDYNEKGDTGQISFDTDNIYAEANFFSSLNYFSHVVTDLDCN